MNLLYYFQEQSRDVLTENYPGGKYWKSSREPGVSEWPIRIVEEIINLVVKAVQKLDENVQLDVLHIVINEVCETITDHVDQTNFKYSTQGGEKLRDHIW